MVSALLLLVSMAAVEGPCTAAAPECTEWITFAGGPARSLVYRTYPLDARNDRITRALVMVHGAGRDAHNYFRTALASAFLAGSLEDTIVVAPRFASNDGRGCRDSLAADEVSWACSGNSWRSGGPAAGNDKLTSYDFMDALLRKLARKEVFPNLQAIVLAGHSAGGQFATRYEMSNTVHEALGLPVTYVVSNPSSYAYLDPTRPAADSKEFRPYSDGRNCTTYDRWPYGLQERDGYAARLSDEQLKKQIVARPAIYLLGEMDTLPLAGFDSSCPAMAQGTSRLAALQQFDRGPAVHRLPNLRVLEIAPGPRSATWTYVTRGAWEANPQNPFEYLMTGDRARPRYCELLTIVAFYALSTALGIGHTMAIGEPLLDGSLCQDVYLSLPYMFGPKLERFALDGREGQILWVFPLTPLEKKYLVANGLQALEDRLEASKVEYWSPFRPSVI